MVDCKLTVIVPVYDEEDNLLRVEKELAEYIAQSKCSTQVLFVNDGSKDDSQKLIEEICERSSSFHFIELAQNIGLSGAIKVGIDAVNTPWLGYIDSDLQTSPMDFDLLVDYAEDYQLVTGIRANRKDTIVKKISSKVANAIRRAFINDHIQDTGCPLKIIHTDVAQRIPFFTGMHRFLPALVMLQEGKVKQVPVRHFPRVAGEAKYHLWNRIKGPLFDLFAYRWMRTRYINYQIKNQK